MKSDSDPTPGSTAAVPAPFTDSVGDSQIPAAVQANEQHAQSGQPLQVQPQFRTWPSAPSLLRQLPPVFDRWKPRDDTKHTRVGSHANPPTPLPPPQPPSATDFTRAHTPSSANSTSMTLRAAPSAHTSTPVVPNPARSIPLRGPGRSRYPTPFVSPSTPTAAPAPTHAPAPAAAPTVLPNPSSPRCSTRERTTTVRMNVSNPGSDGGGLARRPATGLRTELDDVFFVGETHTCDGDDSVDPSESKVSNRFVLQPTTIAEESELPTNVCYNVEAIPIGTRDVLRDHLAAACAHELHMAQSEWDTVTTYLFTIDKPRRRTTKHKSEIGESRASDSYGHNTDVDETVPDALVTQYMMSDDSPEVILIKRSRPTKVGLWITSRSTK